MKSFSFDEKLQRVQALVLIFIVLYFFWGREKRIRTESIELTSGGKTVAVLTTDQNGNPELKLLGKDGRRLQLTPEGVVGWSESGLISFSLQNAYAPGRNEFGPGLTLYDSIGENRAAMYLSGGSPFLTFSSYHTNADHGRQFATQFMVHATTETGSIELHTNEGIQTWPTE